MNAANFNPGSYGPPDPPDLPLKIARLKALARLMDSAYQIPGTKITVGVDSIAGLIPGAGDVATSVVSGYILIEAARLGVPPSLLFRMLFNIGVDTLGGSVPLIGDLFDVAWKSNNMNVGLIERHFHDPHLSRKSTRRFVIILILVVMAIFIAFALLVAAFVAAIIILLGRKHV